MDISPNDLARQAVCMVIHNWKQSVPAAGDPELQHKALGGVQVLSSLQLQLLDLFNTRLIWNKIICHPHARAVNLVGTMETRVSSSDSRSDLRRLFLVVRTGVNPYSRRKPTQLKDISNIPAESRVARPQGVHATCLAMR